jgi:hypothetical protein
MVGAVKLCPPYMTVLEDLFIHKAANKTMNADTQPFLDYQEVFLKLIGVVVAGQ